MNDYEKRDVETIAAEFNAAVAECNRLSAELAEYIAAAQSTERDLAYASSRIRDLREDCDRLSVQLDGSRVELNKESKAKAAVETQLRDANPENSWYRCARFFMSEEGERWLREHQCNRLMPPYQPPRKETSE